MNKLLVASAILVLWGAFYCLVNIGLAADRIGRSATTVSDTVKVLPTMLNTDIQNATSQAVSTLDRQLTATNKQIAIGRSQLLCQTGNTLTHADKAIDAATNAVDAANRVVADADRIVADPEVAKVIHSTRLMVDAVGTAAVHIEGMANSIDNATPAFIASAQQIADSGIKLASSGAAIAKDFKEITDEAVKKKPWYKQAIGYIGATVKIGSVFF